MSKPFSLALMLAVVGHAQLVVYHQSATGGTSSNLIKPYLKVVNQGTTEVPLQDLVLGYLIQESGVEPGALVADCWYNSAGQCADVTARYLPIASQTEGNRKANLRIELGFTRGTLAPGATLELQWGLHVQGYQHVFDETDDWSWTGNSGAWALDSRVSTGNASGIVGQGSAVRWLGALPDLPSGTDLRDGDIVRSIAQGSTFIHDRGNWVLIAEKGLPGPAGAQGVQGPQGLPGPQGATGAAGTSGSASEVAQLRSDLTLLQAELAHQSAVLATIGANPGDPAITPTVPVAHLASGLNGLFLKANGELWSAGAPSGDGTTELRSSPVLIAKAVSEVSSTGSHSLYRLRDGSVRGFGSNLLGQLGIAASTEIVATPRKLSGGSTAGGILGGLLSLAEPSTFTGVFALPAASYLRTQSGLLACGNNSAQALGPNSSESPISTPTSVLFSTESGEILHPSIIDVSGAGSITAFLAEDGSVFVAGWSSTALSSEWRLGPPHLGAFQIDPAAFGSLGSTVEEVDVIVLWSSGGFGGGIFGGLVANNAYGLLLRLADGSLALFDLPGYQESAHVPQGSPLGWTTRIDGSGAVRRVVASGAGALVLTEDGHVRRINRSTALPQGPEGASLGIYAPVSFNPVLDETGAPLEGIVELAGNGSSYLMRAGNGTLWGLGENSGGQLGDGTAVDAPAATRIVF